MTSGTTRERDAANTTARNKDTSLTQFITGPMLTHDPEIQSHDQSHI